MRRAALLIVAGFLAISVAGCGSASKPARSSVQASTEARSGELTSQSCSGSEPSSGGPETRECEFVLPNHRAFNCNMAALHGETPTATEVEHTKACRSLGRVSTPTASRGVVAAIARARTCLVGDGLKVHGGPVPPEGHGAGGPEGELIGVGALIAFYANVGTAKRAEPAVLREARRLGASVDRRDAVTVFWLIRPLPPDLRRRVERCVFT